jgi:sugar phosphate isomerase/epimerase
VTDAEQPRPPDVRSTPGDAAAAPAVALSTASVYPESTADGFVLASRLGYDAVEVMVGIDPISQEVDAVRHLADYHGLPVCAIHAPCLLITQRVWGTDPWEKLRRSAEMAQAVGAGVVVVHPPFRWQREYARTFVEGIARLERRTGLHFAVENMYPWRASRGQSRGQMQAYAPGWDVTEQDYAHTTLDLSHSATSRSDPVAMARSMGERLRHVHLADGTGSAKDEHLIPGRGNQPCAQLLEELADDGFTGNVVVEVNTRRAPDHAARELDLAEALAFARLHFAVPAGHA